MDRKIPEPIYKGFKGWHTDTSIIRSYEALPETTRTYVDFINGYLGVKVHYISNGPGRDQIVLVPWPGRTGNTRYLMRYKIFFLKIWRIKNFAEILHP